MKHITSLHKNAVSILISIVLLLSGCKGVGIFAYVATTKRIDKGLLPEGMGTSRILTIKKEYSTHPYDYFTSVSLLYRSNTQDRDASTRNKWSSITLPSGWTNIQSVAASDDKLLLALSRHSSGTLSTGLYYYTAKDGFSLITINNDILLSDDSSYRTVLLYCPNPSAANEVFYVNVLEYSGDFGQKSTFSGSTLYLIGNTNTDLNSTHQKGGDWDTALKSSYISSAAYDKKNTYRFTIINPVDETGQLTDESGKQIAANTFTLPSGALTWLPGAPETDWPDGVFIAASWKLDETAYPLYISADGTNWETLTSSYRFSCFLDVTSTKAGGRSNSPNDNLILAGTRSVGNSSSSGYMEIVANTAEPSQWEIRTNKSDFTFAQTGTYIASDLSSDAISGLTLYEDYVYASTDKDGVWRINANDQETYNGAGLEWERE